MQIKPYLYIIFNEEISKFSIEISSVAPSIPPQYKNIKWKKQILQIFSSVEEAIIEKNLLEGKCWGDQRRLSFEFYNRTPSTKKDLRGGKPRTIIATNITTGEKFEMTGGREILARGFSANSVYKAAREDKLYQNHTFRYK